MELTCNNRGCGKRYNPRDNPPDSKACAFHPGAPYFHDAYKGWSCCGKKCTDFTEFLNVPGCALGPHSNLKPEEPESITGRKDNRDLKDQLNEFGNNEIYISTPIAPKLPRPSFDNTPLTRLVATKATSLKAPSGSSTSNGSSKAGEIADGESCKNGGCKASYSADTCLGDCIYHPGVPIFHEGMKFWSCCQRKTTDFQAFLEQAGCMQGKHRWVRENDGSASVECRHDWHQTATHVVVAIYGKNYHPDTSYVEASPIRLKIHIYFPEQAGAFDLDLELAGVIVVEETTVSFLGTKVEIKMKKAEPGLWSKLDFPRQVVQKVKKVEPEEPDVHVQVDALDLDDLEVPLRRAVLSNEASGGRTGQPVI